MIKVKKCALASYVIVNILFTLVCSFLYRIHELKYINFSKYFSFLLILNIIVLMITIWYRVKNNKKINLGIADVLILLMLIFGGISIIFAKKPGVAIYGMAGRYEGYLMYLYYFSIFLISTFVSYRQKKVIVYFILFSGLLELIYSILQVCNIKWAVRVFNYGKIWATGFTTNPNFFATLMLICLSYSMGLFADEKRFKIIYAILMVLFMIGIMIGNAMSCVVGSIVVLFYLLLFEFKQKKYKNMIFVVILLLFGVFITCKTGMTTIVKDFKKTTSETKEIIAGNVEENYGTKRIFIWKRTIKIIPKYIWTGVGIDNFYYAFGDFPLSKNGVFYDKAHNEYLQVLVTQGIFALITYLCFYGYILINGVKNSIRTKRLYLLLPVIGYLVQAFFNFSVIEVAPFTYIALGLCLDRFGECDEKSKCNSTCS